MYIKISTKLITMKIKRTYPGPILMRITCHDEKSLFSDSSEHIFPKMHWSEEVHCEEGRDDPFHCTTLLRSCI